MRPPSHKHRRPQANQAGGPRSEIAPKPGERVVIGIHSVEETLRSRASKIRTLALRTDVLGSQQMQEIETLAKKFRVQVSQVSAKSLDSFGSGHQGVLALVTETPEFNLEIETKKERSVLLACDGVEDPGNLGALLRSAWLLNTSAVLLPKDRAVGLTPTVSKIASGGVEHVAVETVTNLAATLKELKDAGYWIFGLAEVGTQKLWNLKLPEKIVWVVGSESSGLRKPVERACDELVLIPQVEAGSSYNVATAAALALYETQRQHLHS